MLLFAVPDIGEDQEHNARTGFFERDAFGAVLAGLPDDLQTAFAVAYITQSGWLRLEPGETKNAEGRQFPLTPALRAVLER